MLTGNERKARLDMLRAVLDKLTYPTDNPSGLADHCRWLLSEVERLEKQLQEAHDFMDGKRNVYMQGL